MTTRIPIALACLAATLLLTACDRTAQSVSPGVPGGRVTTVSLLLRNASVASDTATATWQQLRNPTTDRPGTIDLSRATLRLRTNTTYNCLVVLTDFSATPTALNVTDFYRQRANVYQVFFQPLPTVSPLTIPDVAYPPPIPTPPTGPPLNLVVTPTDRDTNLPVQRVGLQATFTARAASTGWLRLVLRHQPNAKNGTFAPGTTVLDAGFNVVIQ